MIRNIQNRVNFKSEDAIKQSEPKKKVGNLGNIQHLLTDNIQDIFYNSQNLPKEIQTQRKKDFFSGALLVSAMLVLNLVAKGIAGLIKK